MIDSHCHLNHDDFFADPKKYIDAAMRVGVSAFLVVGYDLKSSLRAIELSKRFDNVYAAIGIHPTDIKSRGEGDLKQIEALLDQPKVIACGEIGLDYYWDKDEAMRREQRACFIEQIEMANRHRKPIIVHTRDAAFHTHDLLVHNPPIYGGIMHCYSGSAEMVDEYASLGLYISLGGPVTFLNAKTPKEVAKSIALDRLLIETDAPYLAPHPLRGQRNETKNLRLICEEIARLRGCSFDEVDRATTANFEKLFGLHK